MEVMRVTPRCWLWLSPFVIAWFVSGCTLPEMHYVLSPDSKNIVHDALADDPAAEQKTSEVLGELSDALDEVFGTPKSPHAPSAVARVVQVTDAELADGAASYRRLCMHCHGLSGDGAGPTAGPKDHTFLFPRPRDFRLGRFKFTSTLAGEKPTYDDLLHTVRSGITGTAMPSFALYDPQEIGRTVDYVILLAVRGETERSVVSDYQAGDKMTAAMVEENADQIARLWTNAPTRTLAPKSAPPLPTEDPKAFAESVKRGEELFLSTRAQCFTCHGREGRGDGWKNDPIIANDPKKTVDDWGNLAVPADLTQPIRFRGGGRPIDLFRRIHAGVKGTPMPAQGQNLSEAEIWDLVNYVRALAFRGDQAVALTQSAQRSPDTAHPTN